MKNIIAICLIVCALCVVAKPALATDPVRIVEVQHDCHVQQVQQIQRVQVQHVPVQVQRVQVQHYVQPVVQRIQVQRVVQPVHVQRVQVQRVQVNHIPQIQRIQRVQVQRINVGHNFVGQSRRSITVRQPGLLGRILGRGSVVQIRD